MTPVQGKSKRKIVLIAVGAVAVVAVLIGAGYALLLATTKNTAPAPEAPDAPTKTVVPGQSIEQGIEKLNTSVDKEKAQREKAQQALNDHVKRTTLAN